MKNLELDLMALLQDERALTILKLEDGWMVSFSSMTQEDKEIIFIPDKMILSDSTLSDALQALRQYQQMEYVKGFQA